MTTSLYSLRSTPQPGEFTILKFSPDYDVESVYALSEKTCTCPQGHKPKCKHRTMLRLFLTQAHVDDGWFLDWSTRLWRHPVGEVELTAERKLADTTIMGNADQDEVITQRMAGGFASEGAYGTSPALSALQDIKAINQLPPEERRAANREFVSEQLAKQGFLDEPQAIQRSPLPNLTTAQAVMEEQGNLPAKPGAIQVQAVEPTAVGESPTPIAACNPPPVAKPGELRRRRF